MVFGLGIDLVNIACMGSIWACEGVGVFQVQSYSDPARSVRQSWYKVRRNGLNRALLLPCLVGIKSVGNKQWRFAMNNLDRLIKAEGVQGGILAEYERRFRKYVDVRLSSDDDAMNLSDIAFKLEQMARFLSSEYWNHEAYKLARLCRKAACAHIVIERV